jgi:hypothetical protein
MVSNVAFKLNDKKSCVNYTEKAYISSGDYETLALLTERCIWASNDDKLIIYAEEFISNDKFNNYATNTDEGYAYYITSAFVIALYNKNYVEKSVETAFQHSNGFQNIGPVHRLIAVCNDKGDTSTLLAIKEKLTLYNDEYATYLISVIDGVLNKG